MNRKLIAIASAIFALVYSPLMAKENLPAAVFGLKNDTLYGEIKVKNAFDKGKDQAYAYLQFSIEFKLKDGQEKEFKPDQIKGFVIWTSDSTYEKYVSATLLYTESSKNEESAFRRPGMAARSNIRESMAFVRELSDKGKVKLYVFYEDDVLVSTNMGAGMPPSAGTPTYQNSLNARFLLRKGNGTFIKLNAKSKRRKVQLLKFFEDCPKIQTVLEKPKLDTGEEQVLRAIVMSYNTNCGK